MTVYAGYLLPSTVVVIDCARCQQRHPATRNHCGECNRASLFINPETGLCLTCKENQWQFTPSSSPSLF